MKLNRRMLEKSLLPLGVGLGVLVVVSGTLQWPLGINYAFTALMFAAFFGARSVDRRNERRR